MQITSNASHSLLTDIPDANLSPAEEGKFSGNHSYRDREQHISPSQALRCHGANASLAPRPVDFSASPQENKADKPTSPARSFGGSGANSPETLVKMMQIMLTELMQLLFKMLASFQDPSASQSGGSPADGGGDSRSPSFKLSPNTTSPAMASGSPVNDATPANKSAETSMPGLPPQLQQFSKEYADAAKETGVPASTLAALTWTESRGNVQATSTNPGNGETDGGMNQINPDTYEAMREKYPDKLSGDANDPHNQILCSALMLRDYQQQFGGNMDAALRAYNSGPNQVNLNDLSLVTLGNPNYVNEVNSTARIIASGQGTVPA
ncbi:lytic transglycosylase domain-containing protein [Kosakonia oryzae]|uniref:Lytic transglycosylase domain-containing protein n=1 Tax=Kosakonia oryzae TaxID=497725 RepID=A0AA94KR67_9ENTR|nr:lytic transglycosylase domain-containing protein [Kosakonia oryzae]ANI81293.2 lytic transglycosylase domain-containing protein [Kosakonia oryzae]UDJ83224.1 lytic transglycosylase domain-containing protein [Kosakonia oryzae]SFC87842.1 Transglycosylase SLT domain-containing protein [Kosakonia oryzae]